MTGCTARHTAWHSKLTLFLTFDLRVMTKDLISRLCLYPSYLLKFDFMIIDFIVSFFSEFEEKHIFWVLSPNQPFQEINMIWYFVRIYYHHLPVSKRCHGSVKVWSKLSQSFRKYGLKWSLWCVKVAPLTSCLYIS